MQECSMNRMAILKALGWNYPIILEWGLEPRKLIIVVVEQGELKNAIDILSDITMPKLNALINNKQLQDILTEYMLSFAVYPYFPTRKNNEFLATLSNVVQVGEINGKKLGACPIVVTENIPSGIDLQDFFTVYISGNIDSSQLNEIAFVPMDNQVSVVEDKIRKYLFMGKSTEERALYSAICFMYPGLVKSKKEFLIEKYIEEARRMVIQDEENKDLNNVMNIFIHEVYRWQENAAFSDVYELPYLEMNVVDKMNRIVLYDSDYLYIKEAFFKEIISELLKLFSVDAIKRELCEQGILSSDKSKTYTIKMTYVDVSGQYQRERMLRFVRKNMEILGEMEFIEQCVGRRSKNA